MQFTEYFAAQTGQPVSALLPLVTFKFDGESYGVAKWDASLGAEPTPAQLAAIAAMPDPAPSKAQLLAYANTKQWALATGGHTVTVGGSPHVFATDAVSLTMMGGKVARLAQPSPPASFNWQTPDGAWLTIAAGDFPAVATACADFVQATFDALKTVEAQVAAGTITTLAQIDAYAWPV